MNLRLPVSALAILTAFAAAGPASQAFAKGVCSTLTAEDTDKDGTLDLNEAKQAAMAVFDKLDTDKDGTLSLKELQGRLSPNEFAAGDPDHDKTLSKDEYLAIVAARFKAADRDGEGTIDCKEAKTGAGQALFRLLK